MPEESILVPLRTQNPLLANSHCLVICPFGNQCRTTLGPQVSQGQHRRHTFSWLTLAGFSRLFRFLFQACTRVSALQISCRFSLLSASCTHLGSRGCSVHITDTELQRLKMTDGPLAKHLPKENPQGESKSA